MIIETKDSIVVDHRDWTAVMYRLHKALSRLPDNPKDPGAEERHHIGIDRIAHGPGGPRLV
jgi:hypothetical protein